MAEQHDIDPSLTPANLDAADAGSSYRARFPWKWLLLSAALTAAVSGVYYYRQHQTAVGLREQILQAYEGPRLGPVVERYRAFRGQLESWVRDAARRNPQSFAEQGMRVARLQGREGLYLRLLASKAKNANDIALAALAMDASDGVTRCLGIQASSARTVYAKGGFLMPGWIDEVRGSSDLARLQVKDDELTRLLRRDLPPVSNMMQRPWFLLVLERDDLAGNGTAPVDVYAWELATKRLLFATRTTPDGVLIPVRYVVAGVAPAPRQRTMPRGSIAMDCSIAAQVKELLGETPMTFGAPGATEALQRATAAEGAAHAAPGGPPPGAAASPGAPRPEGAGASASPR